ncbi:hypothetical protein KCP71_23830 [Salmonella enterica subsp. enterica]|nr:hypothetical protein KCP71_23830 [Salmonella enterica subsp. enterica]
MLASAAAAARGLDVVIGVVETHGREETAALLDGLTILCRQNVTRTGGGKFAGDTDAALARRPALILMDERWRTVTRGSRHPKRWQDIERAAGGSGVDVFYREHYNIWKVWSCGERRHGDSGARNRPRSLFDAADEVVLVDLPLKRSA